MYYTVRPAGPRSKKEQVQFYFMLTGQVIKTISGLFLVFFGGIASLTRNYGALAFLFLILLLCGIGFNLFGLQTWLPGWRKGTWFTRAITVTIYVFVALAVLLLSNPLPL